MCSLPWGARSTASTVMAAETAYTIPITASCGMTARRMRVREKSAAPHTVKASAYQ